MKKGWLIYNKVDVNRNEYMINRLIDFFKSNHIELKLISYSEGINLENEAIKLAGNKVDFVINRSRFYEFSDAFEKQGVKVFNKARTTKICNDKFKTYKALVGVVDFMPTSFKNEVIYSGIKDEIDYPFVAKSLDGHGGEEVYLIKEKSDLEDLKRDDLLHQKLASNEGIDVRFYILGNEIVAAVKREAYKSFKSNYSLGGKVSEYLPSEEEKLMIKKILKVIDIDYGGIDFIYHNNRPVFNEIEDAVGAKMLYQTSKIDIIGMYCEYILSRI